MQTDFVPTTTGRGYSDGPATKAPNWHGLVAWDMLLNSLTTGLFLVAAVGELAAPATFSAVATVAYPIALVLLLGDLLCLVLDLGDPWRFHHMLRVFKPSSPMSLGTWCLTAYSLPLTAAVALGLLPAEWALPEWVRRVAVVLGIVPALGAATYKGVLFSTTAQPGWKDARWLGGYLTNSAIVLGSAELLAVSVLMGQERAAAVLRPALVASLLLNVVLAILVIANLRPALHKFHTHRQLQILAALCFGGGTLVPLGLLLFGADPFPVLAAVLFLLLGSLAVRYAIVRLPHAAGPSE